LCSPVCGWRSSIAMVWYADRPSLRVE
jgi:hypothetical protein